MHKPNIFANYRDLSHPMGANPGFQFEFFCECCGDAWCTKRTPYRSGRILERLAKAAGVFGGIAAGACRALEVRAHAEWHSIRAAALTEAVSQAQWHFRCCSTCMRHVCARCAGSSNGVCFGCASTVNVTPVLRTQGELQALPKLAMVEGVARQVKPA